MGKRLRNFHIPVIMGGAHPRFLSDEALEYADFVIRGKANMPLWNCLNIRRLTLMAITGCQQGPERCEKEIEKREPLSKSDYAACDYILSTHTGTNDQWQIT